MGVSELVEATSKDIFIKPQYDYQLHSVSIYLEAVNISLNSAYSCKDSDNS